MPRTICDLSELTSGSHLYTDKHRRPPTPRPRVRNPLTTTPSPTPRTISSHFTAATPPTNTLPSKPPDPDPLIHSKIASQLPAARASLPLDPSLETILSIISNYVGLVLGAEELRPIKWMVWAGRWNGRVELGDHHRVKNYPESIL